MPPVTAPDCFKSSICWKVSSGRMFFSVSMTPATSVRSSSLAAPRAPATAPALVSALMFRGSPPCFTWLPRGATTGTTSAATRSSKILALTLVGSPTKPRSTTFISPVSESSTDSLAGSASMRLSSLPLMPTALPPAAQMPDTIALLIEPERTISATSMVAASVTRKPSMKVLSIFRRLSMAAICGPPPCTITGFIPHCCSSTTSRANPLASEGSTMACPPYLITTVRPW
mmetsp:Transcript_4891/g.7378  ORF Transcript_4891/g.7378 Transcript_4891/m.7378 type:complete len:230 (+) Transcript_4891:226-915(+)